GPGRRVDVGGVDLVHEGPRDRAEELGVGRALGPQQRGRQLVDQRGLGVLVERAGGQGQVHHRPHHFGGGKTQLAEETTRFAGEFIVAGTVAALGEADPIAAVDTFRRWWTRILRDSDYAAGCVIVAATLEGEREPSVRDAAG